MQQRTIKVNPSEEPSKSGALVTTCIPPCDESNCKKTVF